MAFIDDAITYARIAIGRLDATVEYTDVEIKAVVVPIADFEFSKFNPRIGRHTLQVQDGVSLYALPTAYIMAIKEAGPAESAISNALLGSGFFFRLDQSILGLGQGSNAYLTSYSRETIDSAATFNVQVYGGQILVEPDPTSTRAVYLQTYDAWDFSADADHTTVPFTLQLAYKYFLASRLARQVAMERSKIQNITVGSSRMSISVKEMLDLQVELFDDGRASSEFADSVVMQG